MNKIFVLILIVLFNSEAYADDWKKVSSNDERILYYSTKSFKIKTTKNEDKRYFNVLIDYYEPNEGILSAIHYGVVNCENKLMNILQSTTFRRPMGEGNPINTVVHKKEDWFKPFWLFSSFCAIVNAK